MLRRARYGRVGSVKWYRSVLLGLLHITFKWIGLKGLFCYHLKFWSCILSPLLVLYTVIGVCDRWRKGYILSCLESILTKLLGYALFNPCNAEWGFVLILVRANQTQVPIGFIE